ncbi:VanZ family protein [Flavobacteriaceae bacterium]|nr:VanZ family protein [Flavobacteriaceae bacterium]
MPRKILFFATICYSLFLGVMSLVKSSHLPEIDIDNSDKYAHALAYGLLCSVWYLTLCSYNFLNALVLSSFIAVIYGIIIEVLQGVLTEVRTPDFNDFIANCCGIIVVSVIISIRNKTQVKNL